MGRTFAYVDKWINSFAQKYYSVSIILIIQAYANLFVQMGTQIVCVKIRKCFAIRANFVP